jgi:hypothetical protein
LLEKSEYKHPPVRIPVIDAAGAPGPALRISRMFWADTLRRLPASLGDQHSSRTLAEYSALGVCGKKTQQILDNEDSGHA